MPERLDDAVFALAAIWREALETGQHVPLRREWPELANKLDALIDAE